MKPYAESFYKSKAWQRCRAAYVSYRSGLCELCLAEGKITPGDIVHHKVHLTPYNIHDPDVSLSFPNLQLVCREHHARLHGSRTRRHTIDEWGRVTAI